MRSPAISPSLFNRLRYKHLHMLVALSSSQNLHRASQALNMSQPAATRMLREIEDMFGCDLFERLPRGMRPTALGQQLINFAESALSGLDRCAEDLMARMASCARDVVAESVAGLSEAEQNQLLALLERVRSNLSDEIPAEAET